MIVDESINSKIVADRNTLLHTPKRWWYTTITLSMILVAFYLPMLIFMTEGRLIDYKLHMNLAFEIEREFSLDKLIHQQYSSPLPHFAYHLQVAALHSVLPVLTEGGAAAFPVVVSQVMMGLICFHLVKKQLPESDCKTLILSGFIAASLLLVDPIIIIPWGHPGAFYSGYIPVNIYHNPTTNVLKPWAIICSLIALPVISGNHTSQLRALWNAAFAVLVTTIVTLTKPNYIICFLPIFIFVMIYKLLKNRRLDNALLWAGLIIPPMVLLSLQYSTTYVNGTSNVNFGLFTAIRAQGVEDYQIVPKLLASIAFPVFVYVVYPRARRDMYLNLSWAIFFLGLLFTYGVFETGKRLGHGNFIWSGQLTLMGVFLASTLVVLREHRDLLVSGKWGILPRTFFVTSLVFGLHLVSGIFFYALMWYAILSNLR